MQRLTEIEMDGRICFPNDKNQEKFLSDETKLCKRSGTFLNYLNDLWYYIL